MLHEDFVHHLLEQPGNHRLRSREDARPRNPHGQRPPVPSEIRDKPAQKAVARVHGTYPAHASPVTALWPATYAVHSRGSSLRLGTWPSTKIRCQIANCRRPQMARLTLPPFLCSRISSPTPPGWNQRLITGCLGNDAASPSRNFPCRHEPIGT